MLMFVASILLYEIINNKPKVKTTAYSGGVIFFLTLISIILLMVYKIPQGSWWRNIIIYLGFFMLCYECFSWQGSAAKFFSYTLFRWLGNMSYSYYLIHGLAVKAIIIIFSQFYFTAQISELTSFIVFGLLVYILILVPAFLLFVYIEKPFLLVKINK